MRMAQLFSFIRRMEGDIDHFYRDSNGLVTIGVGYLVDSDEGLSSSQVEDAISQILRAGITFYHRRDSSQATLRDIIHDWQQVKRGRSAQLYITRSASTVLLEIRTNGFIDQLYDRRPFADHLHELIQMAIIDARFNPARVRLYSTSNRQLVNFWNALDPRNPNYNLNQALTLFQWIWRGRGIERYRQRHAQRVLWFREGIDEMARMRSEALDRLLNDDPGELFRDLGIGPDSEALDRLLNDDPGELFRDLGIGPDKV